MTFTRDRIFCRAIQSCLHLASCIAENNTKQLREEAASILLIPDVQWEADAMPVSIILISDVHREVGMMSGRVSRSFVT